MWGSQGGGINEENDLVHDQRTWEAFEGVRGTRANVRRFSLVHDN